ncbi:MAG: hypothetical protein JSS79_02240 [Bacteroidetes bacterium]|nr:hypothetical protein [Bacteroidota bacterium]
MKLVSVILLKLLLFSCCLAQQKYSTSQDTAYSELVWRSNTPDKLFQFYNQANIKGAYAINRELNPFYLRGDFDGDKNIDYAIAVIEKKSSKKGILIYHPSSKKYFLAGAGQALGYGDDYPWMDAWQVYEKKYVGLGVGETKRIKLKGEAILVEKLESSSGLIYWDGKKYEWYQQGD